MGCGGARSRSTTRAKHRQDGGIQDGQTFDQIAGSGGDFQRRLAIGFKHRPRLGGLEVSVSNVGKLQKHPHRVVVVQGLVVAEDLVRQGAHLSFLRRRLGDDLPLKILVDELEHAMNEIAEIVHQLSVYRVGEMLNIEVQIGRLFGKVGGVIETEILRGQLGQVIAGGEKGAAGFAHLLPVDGQKAVHQDVFRQGETRPLQHGRPEKEMDIDDDLPNEVEDPGSVRFPVL